MKVEALDEDSTSVEVTWQKPVEANGVITEYQVIYYGFKRDQLSDVTVGGRSMFTSDFIILYTHTHTRTHAGDP